MHIYDLLRVIYWSRCLRYITIGTVRASNKALFLVAFLGSGIDVSAIERRSQGRQGATGQA